MIKIFTGLCMLASLNGFGTGANAQNSITIKGSVKDSVTGKPMEFATVNIFKAGEKDEPFRNSSTKKNGEFILINVTPGSYSLAITSVGYQLKTRQLKIDSSIDIGTILLSPSAKQLVGVTVTSTRPPIVYKADKMIVNLDAIPSNAGSNLLEALEKFRESR